VAVKWGNIEALDKLFEWAEEVISSELLGKAATLQPPKGTDNVG
jgi:hypothetical protein